jgi:DtxR family Mn-dependent transcriptional regulator
MDLENDFYTQKGYQLKNRPHITGAMEDYLEMICREAKAEGYVRINSLASKLNVRPSSASKMVHNLRALGLVEFEKYGLIRPIGEGCQLGNYLLYRHEVLLRFFRLMDGGEENLEQVEQVEHFLREETVHNLERVSDFLEVSGYEPPKH